MHKRIGILGASGMIGRHIVDFLSNKYNQLILYSNKDTKQRDIVINQRTFEIKKLVKDDTHPIDLIILSTPEHISKQYAPIFLEKNIPIIDLSSAYRMQDNVPLVVYGIHPTCTTTAACPLIALPNCTVSILARALHPLTQCVSIDRCDVCTYQSVSGAGYNAYLEWKQQKVNKSTNMYIFSFPIADNVIPMIGDVDDNGYTSEEISIINETKKVLHLSDCYISATCVRVSVERGHGIAVSIRCKQEVNIKDIKNIYAHLHNFCCTCATPIDTVGQHKIYISRIRADVYDKHIFHFWLTADQISTGTIDNLSYAMQLI